MSIPCAVIALIALCAGLGAGFVVGLATRVRLEEKQAAAIQKDEF